jgi:hypothetical protein
VAFKPRPYETIHVRTHADLEAAKKAICERFNANPELARLLFVNPLFAFEDAGVDMSHEVREHITNRMRYPPKLIERTKRLEAELRLDLERLGVRANLPLPAAERDRLFHEVLKLPREGAALGSQRKIGPRALRALPPIVAKLLEYERARKGALLFYPRDTYEMYKSGARQHRWLRSVRFKV